MILVWKLGWMGRDLRHSQYGALPHRRRGFGLKATEHRCFIPSRESYPEQGQNTLNNQYFVTSVRNGLTEAHKPYRDF